MSVRNVGRRRHRPTFVSWIPRWGVLRTTVGALIACAAVSIGIAGCASSSPDVAPAQSAPGPRLVRVEFVSLQHGRADAVVLAARTACRRVSAVADRAAHRDDMVRVQVSGPKDCARYPRVMRLHVTLHMSGLLWCNGGKLTDASTRRPMPLAAGGRWPVFSCPVQPPA